MLAADGRHGHWKSKQGAKRRNWKRYIAFKTSKPAPNDTLPPARNLPKQWHQLWIKYSNIWSSGGHSHQATRSTHLDPMTAWCKPWNKSLLICFQPAWDAWDPVAKVNQYKTKTCFLTYDFQTICTCLTSCPTNRIFGAGVFKYPFQLSPRLWFPFPNLQDPLLTTRGHKSN